MRRYRQTVDELLGALSAIPTSWRDEHSDAVVRIVERIPDAVRFTIQDVDNSWRTTSMPD